MTPSASGNGFYIKRSCLDFSTVPKCPIITLYASPPFHHLSLAVANLERSAAFYDVALAALGYSRVWTDKTAIGYGQPTGGDKFAIKLRTAGIAVPGDGFHVAFAAPSRDSVAKFFKAALEHGGTDNGGCGIHPEYGSNYYAAFVFDPDGYRIEAVINSGS